MAFEIEFYSSEDGREPVAEFLDSLDSKMSAKLVGLMEILEEKGTELRMPYSEHLEDGIFELRCLVINGEYPQMFECVSCGSKDIHSISISRFGVLCNQCKNQSGDSTYVSGDAIYTLQFIISTEIEKLYTFSVTEEILEELTRIIKKIVIQIVHTNFNSLKILETITT